MATFSLCHALGSWRRLVRFGADRSGNVAIIYAMMAVVLMLAIGAAVDIGRWLHGRDQTVSAVDAAVLAGGRYLQTNPTDAAGAIAAAQKFYAQNVTSRLPVLNDSVTFAVGSDGMSMTASGTAYIKTPFLQFASIDKLPLLSTAATQFSQVQLAVGGNGGQNLEVALMLDITGSMSGQKYYLSDCVVERTGSEKYSDAAPKSGQYVMAHYTEQSTGNGVSVNMNKLSHVHAGG